MIILKNLIEQSLKKQKYNLINEIKKHYNLESFFGSKIKNYKEIASVYTLIESYNNKEDVTDLIKLIIIKSLYLEFLTKQPVNQKPVKKDI